MTDPTTEHLRWLLEQCARQFDVERLRSGHCTSRAKLGRMIRETLDRRAPDPDQLALVEG